MVFTKRGRTLLMVVPLMTVILLSSAASVGRAAAPHASGQTLNIAMVSDVNFLDPNLAGSYYDRQILNNVTDKLFDLDSRGRIVPMLATHYKVSKDHMTYTLTLRKGVKFQDGTPFNAAAVKFNLDRYRQLTSARYPEVKDITSVTAVGSYTVKITLDAPFSPLLSIFTDRSGMMMSPKAVQSEGLNFTLHPVGTGPFIFQERVKGDHITLVRNPHYWRKGYPKASKVVFKIFTDPNVQLVNVQSGQVDLIDDVTSQNVAAVRNDKNLKYINKAGYAFAGFWLNTQSPPFNNKSVREAVSLLIDRKEFVRVTAGKTATAANSPFGPGELAYGSWDKPPARDVKKAKQLLARAHVSDLSFTFKTTTAPISTQQAQIIASYLQAGGFTMNIQAEDFPTILSDGAKHNFQAAAIGWSGRPDPDQNIASWISPGATYNYGQYSNATVNKYMLLARRQVVAKKRQADYGKIAAQLNQDQPYIYLDHANYSMASTKKLQGFVSVPDGIIRCVSMYLSK